MCSSRAAVDPACPVAGRDEEGVAFADRVGVHTEDVGASIEDAGGIGIAAGAVVFGHCERLGRAAHLVLVHER